MKLDQETVVKHQFWFLLGGYFVLWLIAILWMKFTFPGEIEKLHNDYKAKTDGVNSALSAGPVNTATFIPPWDNETKEFSDHKGVIWGQAWYFQEGMYDWPAGWAKKYGGMITPQVQISSDDKNEYKDKLYPNQIKELRDTAPKWLNPVELKDGFDNVFQPKKDWRETPTREEIWLAQEDFWVKRELLIVVYQAMAQQALMEPVEIDEKKEPMPKGVEARHRFRNKNWEITLNIRKNEKGLVLGGDSTIKNIHPSRHPQALTSAKGRGIWFNVAQDNVRTTFEVRGEPVSWNETKHFSAEDYPEPVYGIRWDKEWLKEHPIFVSQGFDQTNCPIRRINAIELAKQDCRTFVWPLQPNRLLEALDALPEDQDPTKKADTSTGGAGMVGGGAGMPSGGAGMPSGGGTGSAMMRPGGMGGGNTAPVGNRTPNNDIERDRYLQPASTDKNQKPLPSRHLPLAIQLVVEQAHMHDVMVALANSRLRFQITQVEFQHDKNFVPQSDGDKKDGGSDADPRVFQGAVPGAGGGPMQMQMRMAMQMRGNMQQGPMGADPMRGGRGGSGAMGPGAGMRGGAMPPGGMRGGAGMGSGAGGPMMMRPPGAPGMAGVQSKFNNAPGTMRAGAGMGAGVDPRQQSNQPDDNLVELTIYGIATLYRAPDAPQTTEQQATPPGSQPMQPAQQQAAPAAQTSGAASQPAPTTQPGGASKPSSPTDQPKNASPPPANTNTPSSGSSPAAPKQGEKTVDQQKAPAPPPPPATNKK